MKPVCTLSIDLKANFTNSSCSFKNDEMHIFLYQNSTNPSRILAIFQTFYYRFNSSTLTHMPSIMASIKLELHLTLLYFAISTQSWLITSELLLIIKSKLVKVTIIAIVLLDTSGNDTLSHRLPVLCIQCLASHAKTGNLLLIVHYQQLYMAVVRAIKEGESSWSSTFQLLEVLVIGDQPKTSHKSSKPIFDTHAESKVGKKVLFCKKKSVR